MTKKALQELASVFDSIPNFAQGETPLLIAVGAVGKALGINICPPAKSESFSGIDDTLEVISRTCGFRTRRVTLTPNWWKKDGGSLVAFTKEAGQPVALIRVKATRYEILDPTTLTRVPVNCQTAAQLAPIAYSFYRPLPDKEITFLNLLQFAFKDSTADLLKLFWLALIATLFGMLTPQITGFLIDYAIPDANRQLLIEMGLGLLAGSFGVTIFQLAQAFAILRVQTRVSQDTQVAVWDRLLKLKPAFFRQYSTGDLYNRISAITEIRARLNGSILRTLFTSLFSLLNLGLLLIYSFPLALVAMAIALVIVLITTLSSLLTRPKLRLFQQLSGDILGLTVQLIGGVSKLRVAAAESEAFAYWTQNYARQVKLMLSSQFIEDLLTFFNIVLPVVSSIVLFGLAVPLIGQSQGETGLSTGTFLAFNTAFGTFIASATRLSNTLIDISESLILWERIQPILKTKPEVDADKSHPGKLSGQLKLNQVSFRYPHDSPFVLENITLEAQAGEFIAIVGPSGSGKSTILRLLLGFETPEVGTVSYDGRDLSGLDITAVRRQLGVVLQNGRIMSGSIWENIAGGAIVSQDEAWLALQMAGLADDVQAMPMGIHTIISEAGGNLSGGQRQRLFIARALVHRPQILLFDEATSALDNRTQGIVTRSLEQLGVTRVVIAHRLSTIRHADRIYVLQTGKIIQQGNFEELAAVEGLFADLMARQMV